jgi:hypothetical protein
MDTPPMEHIMATQTRLTTRRPVRFLRATIAAYMMVACCGLILLSTVSAYAIVRDHRVNSFKINTLIFDILPYEFVSP